jgi:16S rRNA (cytidine1402-2'-O)-methyltransferase
MYLVATPIGNLEDISLRAVRILGEVDLIAAEDTRQTLKLLNHLNIRKPLVSYFEHNKIGKGNYLIEQLTTGKNVALVSDAGCPGISDPGEDMVRLAVANRIPVTMVPGAAAFVTGVVLSGLPAGRFAFEGFLPMNKRSRRERILSLKQETRTIIFYEAPHKLLYTLKDLLDGLGNRQVALARELTKLHEEIVRCTLEEAVQKYTAETPRGEFVVVVQGVDEGEVREEAQKQWEEMELEEHLELYTKTGMDRKEAIKKVAMDRGLSKRDVYNSLLKE